MKLELTVNVNLPPSGITVNFFLPHEVMVAISTLLQRTEQIMATTQETVDGIKAVTEQMKKIGVESGKTLEKVTELENEITNLPQVPQAVSDALDALKQQAQVVDDLVPDAVVIPVPETGGTPAEPGATGSGPV